MTSEASQVPDAPARIRGRHSTDPNRIGLFGLTKDQRALVYLMVKTMRAANAQQATDR